MAFLLNFLKGIVAGIGGVAPGLSGSVLMVIMGVYEKTVHAIGTLFQNFKNNIRYLLPLVLGMGCGVLIFSRAVDFLLHHFEFETRYAFVGLVIGTIPLFYRQVRKEGFQNRYYLVIVAAAVVGFCVFNLNRNFFPPIRQPNFWQSVLMGVSVAGSSIVPGVDSAVILSALGFYELYVSSLANLNFPVLLPAALGLVVGAVVISAGMNWLLKRFHTMTFSVLFGLFLSIIPNMLNESCRIETVMQGVCAIVLGVVGCLISFYLGDIRENNERIRKWLHPQKRSH